jgi:hypothetical protein
MPGAMDHPVQVWSPCCVVIEEKGQDDAVDLVSSRLASTTPAPSKVVYKHPPTSSSHNNVAWIATTLIRPQVRRTISPARRRTRGTRARGRVLVYVPSRSLRHLLTAFQVPTMLRSLAYPSRPKTPIPATFSSTSSMPSNASRRRSVQPTRSTSSQLAPPTSKTLP